MSRFEPVDSPDYRIPTTAERHEFEAAADVWLNNRAGKHANVHPWRRSDRANYRRTESRRAAA